MFPRRPGPSSTVSGRPVSPTGSPGRTSVRRSSSSAAPTAITTGRATVSSRRRIEWLRPFMSAVLKTRMPTAGSSRTSAILFSMSSFELATVRRTPMSLNPWTKSSRPTAAISISHHQELPNHIDGKPALLPAGDEPNVLHLTVFPQDVVEDREDRQRMEMRVLRRLDQVDLLDLPQERPDPGGLDPLQVARDLVVEGIRAQAGHQRGLVEPHHPAEIGLGHLVPARQKDGAVEGGFCGPDPEECLQIHDVDLPLDELPHESIRVRRGRDRLEEFHVIDPGNAVLPSGPVLDLGRRSLEGFGVNRAIQLFEDIAEGRGTCELLEEPEGQAACGHEVLLDLLRRRSVRLRAHDGLDVLQIVAVEVAADHGLELAFTEFVNVVVGPRQVPRHCPFDQ